MFANIGIKELGPQEHRNMVQICHTITPRKIQCCIPTAMDHTYTRLDLVIFLDNGTKIQNEGKFEPLYLPKEGMYKDTIWTLKRHYLCHWHVQKRTLGPWRLLRYSVSKLHLNAQIVPFDETESRSLRVSTYTGPRRLKLHTTTEKLKFSRGLEQQEPRWLESI